MNNHEQLKLWLDSFMLAYRLVSRLCPEAPWRQAAATASSLRRCGERPQADPRHVEAACICGTRCQDITTSCQDMPMKVIASRIWLHNCALWRLRAEKPEINTTQARWTTLRTLWYSDAHFKSSHHCLAWLLGHMRSRCNGSWTRVPAHCAMFGP